jgi:hypothetical protein
MESMTNRKFLKCAEALTKIPLEEKLEHPIEQLLEKPKYKNLKGEIMGFKAKVGSSGGIEDGNYEFEVTKTDCREVDHKGKTIQYFDVYFKVKDVEIKDGFPWYDKVSPKIKLGKFLKKAGFDLEKMKGKAIDSDDITKKIIGKKGTLTVVQNDDGFSEIVSDATKFN